MSAAVGARGQRDGRTTLCMRVMCATRPATMYGGSFFAVLASALLAVLVLRAPGLTPPALSAEEPPQGEKSSHHSAPSPRDDRGICGKLHSLLHQHIGADVADPCSVQRTSGRAALLKIWKQANVTRVACRARLELELHVQCNASGGERRTTVSRACLIGRCTSCEHHVPFPYSCAPLLPDRIRPFVPPPFSSSQDVEQAAAATEAALHEPPELIARVHKHNISAFALVDSGSMVSIARRAVTARLAASAAAAANKHGSFVETGTNSGGTAVVMLKVLQAFDPGQSIQFWGFDSFKGFPGQPRAQ